MTMTKFKTLLEAFEKGSETGTKVKIVSGPEAGAGNKFCKEHKDEVCTLSFIEFFDRKKIFFLCTTGTERKSITSSEIQEVKETLFTITIRTMNSEYKFRKVLF